MTHPRPLPPRRLQGRTALITGSTSGIGLGVATALAAEGANIVLNGLGDRVEIEKIRASLASTHAVKAIYADADLSIPAAIREMMAQARNAFGVIDILVNNAGIQFAAPIEDFPETKWDSILAINLSAAFHTIKGALCGMRAQRHGRIINIAAVHGQVASPFKSAYVASKHGLIGLTKAVALETAAHGITCNAICPGYVWTQLVEQQIEDLARTNKISRDDVIRDIILTDQPNKQFATVEQIGALAVFLCSEAAASITGAALCVDGGWTAH